MPKLKRGVRQSLHFEVELKLAGGDGLLCFALFEAGRNWLILCDSYYDKFIIRKVGLMPKLKRGVRQPSKFTLRSKWNSNYGFFAFLIFLIADSYYEEFSIISLSLCLCVFLII